MADIKEMREKAARTLTEARSMLDSIKDDATPEQRTEAEQSVDRALEEVARIEADIDRREKMDAAQKRIEERAEQVDESRRPNFSGEARGQDTGQEMEYRDAFKEMVRAHGNIAAVSPEARAALEKRAQTTANAAGGYSVPETMLEIIVKSMAAWGPMYDENSPFTVFTTTGGNAMPFPTVDDTGVTAGAHTEGATMTDDGGKDVTFGTKQLDAYEFDTEWLRISKALADDSFAAMEQVVGGLLGERLARIANSKLTTGSGSSDVHGIATAAGAGITAVGASAITSDELIDLQHSVDPAYRRGTGVGFMFNDSTLQAIRKLKDGDGNYLLSAGDFVNGVPGRLLGVPYYINQDVADIATGNRSVLFGDMSKYFVRKVGQPLIMAIQDKDFAPGFGMAGYIRFDGELSDTAAVKALTQA